MSDRFKNHSAGLESPAMHGFAITPNDSAELVEATRALYVGVAGNIAVTLVSGAELDFANVPSGTLLPVRARAVKATGTTAASLLGLL